MIRAATAEDHIDLAKLIMLAMGTLAYKFVKESEDAVPLFEHFNALEKNQYSFENILVYDDGEIRGLICAYDGADLDRLRKPFLSYISSTYGVTVIPEDETQPGEYYIDCLAVFPENQGSGIGKKLINAMASQAKSNGYNSLGLLVKKGNPEAKKLYLKTGFRIKDERKFVGDVYEHLQLEL
ncbi:MAG: N-acetyltransferase [Pedobacter sp.]|nr:MAG: N-acetyltransferase [Pedobacter sp.]